ncbi:hypothetical protein [Streptococcus oralis]|nr:hypothetical protein H354_06801 [Streptococcus oralis subsp. tigurinus AZ_3a]
MKLSDLIDHVEYVSDDKGSLKCAEIRETSEDGKILNVYCLHSMTLSNLIVISDDLEEEIDEVLIDVPCRMKIHLNDIDVSSRTCSFTCDLYKFHVFIEEMSNRRNLIRQVELQINANLESGKINLLELLEIRPVLKSLE